MSPVATALRPPVAPTQAAAREVPVDHSPRASAKDATQEYLGALRDQQCRYLEAVGDAASLVRGHGQVDEVAASTLQLTRQFFDAQRSIVARIGQHEAALRDGGETDVDLLDLAAWDAGAATRQMAALLDGWWSALNSAAARALDETAARRSLVRQIDAIASGAELARAARAPSIATRLPSAVRDVLDRSEGLDLRGLLVSLRTVLAPVVPGPAMVGGIPVPFVRAVPRHAPVAPSLPPVTDPSRDLVIRESATGATGVAAQATRGSAEVDHRLTGLERLERLEQHGRHFWDDSADDGWFPTNAVVSIVGVTAALAAAMALIG